MMKTHVQLAYCTRVMPSLHHATSAHNTTLGKEWVEFGAVPVASEPLSNLKCTWDISLEQAPVFPH